MELNERETMSASARHLIRLAFCDGQEPDVDVVKNQHHAHTLRPLEVERCQECGKRLSQGQHELCPRCDGKAWDRLPLAGREEVRV